jgi:hypothetical protein
MRYSMIQYSTIPPCIVLCHVMSCHVMSCHVMSCHVMSCHVMSCHVISFVLHSYLHYVRAHLCLYLRRLLVRAVGLLQCEEDVERLLLENVGNDFKKGLPKDSKFLILYIRIYSPSFFCVPFLPSVLVFAAFLSFLPPYSLSVLISLLFFFLYFTLSSLLFSSILSSKCRCASHQGSQRY